MSNSTVINIQEKRDIGQVLNTTFAFIKLSYKYLYKDLLIISGPFFIGAGIFSALNQYAVFTYSFGEGPRPLLFTSPLYLLSLVFTIFGWTLAFSIAGNYVLQYKNTRNADFNVPEIRAAVRKDFFRLFIAFILYYLAMGLGFIFLLIPGIYFAVANSLGCINIVLDKNARIGQTFGESRRLIKDNWWRTVGIAIITLIIIYAFTLVFSLPYVIMNFVMLFHRLRGDIQQYNVLFIVLTTIAHLGYCLASPISTIAMAIYYYSLKDEKDEVSLLQRIDSVGKTEQATKTNEGSF